MEAPIKSEQSTEQLPQMHKESGLSLDYFKDASFWENFGPEIAKEKSVEYFFEDAQAFIDQGYIIRTYSKRFPADQFENHKDKKYKERVIKLNEIAEGITARFNEEIVPIIKKCAGKVEQLSLDDRKTTEAFIEYLVESARRIQRILSAKE